MNECVDSSPVVARSSTYLSPAKFNEHFKFWTENQPVLGDIILDMPDACVDEFDRVVKRQSGVDLNAAVRAAMPKTDELVRQIRDQLENGCGVALINRIPAERYSVADNRKLCGYFAAMIAPLMEQNIAGVKLYDVADKKVATDKKVRRSITNLRQDYHTDGGWHGSPARYIGLYCIRNAERGGFSRVTSIMAAYKAMLEGDHWAAIKTLSDNHPWDCQGEHGKFDVPYQMNPLFVENDNGFMSRWYESYVREGYVLKGEEIDAETSRSLEQVAAYLNSQNCIRFILEPGQFQYVNNYTVVHGREAFDDGENSGGRHLIRVWNKSSVLT